ncbi:hypothetical protein CROQUDRAFT_519784 [Cronartium quercuum f. sp. fusiforme G11]|uniref:Uncharacterized protein n=1 Tax=Cronartium quercuum f. sp. fusiforme G11 TaxID=708437 RepID=A0A9P6T565_9BASI|nr:hypothetical protein CROQUDRAFT_519784 [Cronartium quercuum f. sp. fusiforme G11]
MVFHLSFWLRPSRHWRSIGRLASWTDSIKKFKVSAFNLASEALNNSFFLNGLRKPSSDQLDTNWPTPGSTLAGAMDDTYGSHTQFVSYFSSAANGMTNYQGYLWLTCDQDGLLGICPTFASGTILVRNRQQRGDWPSQLGSSQTKTTGPVSPSTSTPKGSAKGAWALGAGSEDVSCGPSEVGPSTW